MNPNDVLKNKVIKTSIKSVTSNDVLIREHYDGVPIQPITTNILMLASYEVSTLSLIGNANTKPTTWKSCKVVAKGEYVNTVQLGDSVYGNDITTTAVYSNNNDYSMRNIKKQLNELKSDDRAKHIKLNSSTLIYEYFIMELGQITAIFLDEGIKESTDKVEFELESETKQPLTLR